jgi:hypothetical protein
MSLGLAVCPPALAAQSATPVSSTNSTALATAQTNVCNNFTLLISGNGTVTPNCETFLEGQKYTLNAIAANGSVFANWVSNGIVVTAIHRYTFVAASNLLLQASFVPNPFQPIGGTYHGLFYVTSNANEQSSGSFVATVGSKGAYTAQLRLGAQNHVFSGEFSINGVASKTIQRPGLSPLAIQLQLDLSNGPLTGTVSDGTWTADLAANRAIYSKTNPAPQAGKYTLLIPGGEKARAQPGGNGFGAVTVDALGHVTFSGMLGDGTPVTSSGVVCSQGEWPFYISLYGGKGSMLGWLSFTNDGGISGQLGWFKMPQPKARLYPGGFTNGAEVIGSVYQHTNGLPVLGLTDGQLLLTNGNLAQGITNPIVLGPNNEATGQNTDKLIFGPSSGLFKGSVMNSNTGKPIDVNGIVLQNQNFGAGYFLGTTESGSVLLSGTGATGTSTSAVVAELSNTTTTVSTPPSSDATANIGLALVPPQNSSNSATADPQNTRLGYWRFNNADYLGEEGQKPIMAQAALVPSWSGTAIAMTNTDASSQLMYNVVESNGQTNFDCATGTVRFWFQPNWSTGSPHGPKGGYFFRVGGANGLMSLGVVSVGTNYDSLMQFAYGSNQFWQGSSFGTGSLQGAPVNFQSNHWYQITLTYSATNIALYTNGALLATGNLAPGLNTSGPNQYGPILSAGNGVSYYPSAAERSGGFGFGNFAGLPCAVLGQLDELETFNYPLTPQAVAAGFPTFAGNSLESVMSDSNYVGRSDMLQRYVDGNPATVAQCRLGCWRFDSDTLMTEQGQVPLSYNDVGLAPSWSGTALNINGDPASQVTYWDVCTNGWANINCRQGSLRFWFKPNVNDGPGGPFIYMGSPDGVDKWELALNSGASSISFITGSNGMTTPNLTANCKLSPGHWTQIVLTYGSERSSLYLNGALAATGDAVSYWPSLTNRNLGMVIGNNTAYNNAINGQFDEMETFNYELDPTNILSNFQIVQAVDSDLDGVPDLLEDMVLPVSRPFLGSPVVVTGTIEAEQFDMGGPGIAYQNIASNPASSYRPTGMLITNCDDLGLGYCLDQTRAGEWVRYTINVLMPQAYTIETRVEGIGTNGVFECEFTGSGIYTNTGPLTIASTNWTNVSAEVYLSSGIYTMTLRCLTNGTDGQHVGRFNYISIYPWWQAGFTSTHTNAVTETELSTNNNWLDARNNAEAIQQAIDTLPATGGTVLLPAGTYYVSQASPNEANDASRNAAVSILTNNIEIAGAGKTNTTLIAYNRATTVFCLGQTANASGGLAFAPYTNFILRDMTIEGQPHWAVSNIAGTNIIYDAGQLSAGQTNDLNTDCINGPNTGAETVFYPYLVGQCPYNILITNCQFLYGWNPVTLCGNATMISNVLVRACDFNVWGGSNTNFGNVGIFGSALNVVIIENTFNGNMNLDSSANGCVSTNDSEWIGPAGFVWLQQGGNLFVARNAISNYNLEAVQVNAGPNAIVGNTFQTLISDVGCCALCALGGPSSWAWGGPGIANFENATCFVGNSVYGGRNGVECVASSMPYTFNCSGNWLHLYPPFAEVGDGLGAATVVSGCQTANVCGNTLDFGALGFLFANTNDTALILNNDFSGASYRAIGAVDASDRLNTAQIFGNILGQGSTFHAQVPFANSFGWFLSQNEYLNAVSNSVPPFLDPISSAAHVSD